MRIHVTSRDFTRDEVAEVVRFVRPNGISNFDVEVKNSEKPFAGRAYWNGCSYHNRTSCPLVVIRIGSKKTFPFHVPREKGTGYLEMDFYTQLEALVGVMAHELRHLWQKNHSRGLVWGARGRFSERDADAYALNRLRAWRREN